MKSISKFARIGDRVVNLEQILYVNTRTRYAYIGGRDFFIETEEEMRALLSLLDDVRENDPMSEER